MFKKNSLLLFLSVSISEMHSLSPVRAINRAIPHNLHGRRKKNARAPYRNRLGSSPGEIRGTRKKK